MLNILQASGLTGMIFIVTLISGAIILLSLIWSILLPSKRIWPPPKKESWQFWFTWIFYTVNIIGGIVLGPLDWNSGGFGHWLRYPLGGLLIVGGLGLASWGIRTLGWHRTSGQKGSLVREGPYHFTRNPQYVGDSLAMLGYALFTNSSLVAIVNLLGVIGLLITPLTEEPWLLERFGDHYQDYKMQSGRYLSINKIAKTIADKL